MRWEFFGEIDIDDNGILDQSLAYIICSLAAFETDMTGLSIDVVAFLGGPDMQPGGDAWEVWKKLWVWYADSLDVFE